MNSGQKQQWLALVRKTLPGRMAAQVIAGALADRMNAKTGRLNPSHQTLANDCGLCERTSQRAVRELLNADLIEITRPDGKGRGSSNHYRLKGVSAVTLKDKKGRHGSHPLKPIRVTERTLERVTEVADESERMNPPSALTACAAEEGKNINGEHDDDCCVGALDGRTPQSSSETVEKGKRALAEIRANLSADRGKGGQP